MYCLVRRILGCLNLMYNILLRINETNQHKLNLITRLVPPTLISHHHHHGRWWQRTNGPPPPTISSTFPFFLGPQDRPGDFITPTRLTANNYDRWVSDVQMALEGRRKFGFLDGTITTPTPPCTTSKWSTIQAMLISWIMMRARIHPNESWWVDLGYFFYFEQ